MMSSSGQHSAFLSSYKLSPVPLSVAGQPVLIDEEGEVHLKITDNVKLFLNHSGSQKATTQELLNVSLFILTNFRAIIICKPALNGTSVAWGVSLSEVETVDDCSTFFSRSTRLSIAIKEVSGALQVKFVNYSEKDIVINHFRSALQKRSWELLKSTKSSSTAVQQPAAVFSVTNAGLAGIQRRQEENLRAIDSLARDAVADLDALMNRAREVVSVIQRYAAVDSSEKQPPSVGGGGSGGSVTDTTASDTTGEASEVESLMQSIGIASPVTKYSAGRLYHQQLSRQLADFLLERSRLQSLGGIATSTDVYCLFNRARGTELVSPDDFLRASELLVTLSLGIAMKRFRTGVIAIRLDTVNEDVLCSHVIALSKSSKDIEFDGMQPSLVANRLNVSMVIAKEVMLFAEEKGLLCRDESLAGTFFFANRFASQYQRPLYVR